MTPTEPSGHERLAKQRRYRWLYFGSAAGGVAGMIAGTWAGYPFVGTALYWLGVLAMLGIWRGTGVELFDEREQRLERRAATLTLTGFAVVLVAVAPAFALLEDAGVYDTPTMLEGAIWGYVALYLVFGVVYVASRLRS